MAKKKPFYDFFNSICYTKVNLLETGVYKESDYSPYLVNRLLAHFSDTLYFACEMNLNYDMPARQQYEYLLASVPKRKRFTPHPKFGKRAKQADVEILREYYKCSETKAKEIAFILTPEDIEMLRERLYKVDPAVLEKQIKREKITK